MATYRAFNPVRRVVMTQMERDYRAAARAKSIFYLAVLVCILAIVLFF